ncbi:hypothetical protein PROFUN_09355 [Planoprotostelium fungivorum]|uniref:Uncharacterized protein n=1 Tax=Planoprotostelium fungivorum TaxID=1890364 RepID=A0A2P6NGX1_9EUKA|nr:hypothetical protein PROFUN_09355 [Planoprotostelium fungivorum]
MTEITGTDDDVVPLELPSLNQHPDEDIYTGPEAGTYTEATAGGFETENYAELQPEKSATNKKSFPDLLSDYSITVDGHLLLDYENVLHRFQSRKRNASHYKLNMKDEVERNGKRYIPLRDMMRFFESNGFSEKAIFEEWRLQMVEQNLLGKVTKLQKKRKRNETYDVSHLGLMSSCDCHTSVLVPQKKRLGVKPLGQMADQHYARAKATQIVDTLSSLLSNLNQKLEDVTYYKAISDPEWFRGVLYRFYEYAPRCVQILRDTLSRKLPPDHGQRKGNKWPKDKQMEANHLDKNGMLPPEGHQQMWNTEDVDLMQSEEDHNFTEDLDTSIQ